MENRFGALIQVKEGNPPIKQLRHFPSLPPCSLLAARRPAPARRGPGHGRHRIQHRPPVGALCATGGEGAAGRAAAGGRGSQVGAFTTPLPAAARAGRKRPPLPAVARAGRPGPGRFLSPCAAVSAQITLLLLPSHILPLMYCIPNPCHTCPSSCKACSFKMQVSEAVQIPRRRRPSPLGAGQCAATMDGRRTAQQLDESK